MRIPLLATSTPTRRGHEVFPEHFDALGSPSAADLRALRLRWLATAALLALAAAACSSPEEPPADTGAGVDTGDPDTADSITGSDIKPDLDTAETETATGACVDAAVDCATLKLGACERAVCKEGVCATAPAAADTTCDDGKKCTVGDKCTAEGTCDGKIECANSDTCKDATCNDLGECSLNDVPAGLKRPCDDKNACTDNDVCGFGTCGGIQIDVAKTCDDDQSCTLDECDAVKKCVHTPLEKDKACDDGDQCTAGDKCDAVGACVSGAPVTCTATSGCAKASCDKAKGCVEEPHQDGVSCNDGDSCTGPDECKGGACDGPTVAAAVPANACILVKCVGTGATPVITQSNASNGASCSDEDPCTQNDVCTSGKCGGAPLKCNDGNACTDDACDPKTGTCGSTPVADGATCDDGNKCTAKDACVKGKCTGEDYTVSKACDDGNICTNDGCAPQTGCFAVAKNSGACDDGDKCTDAAACVAGKCIGKAKVCNDNNPCTNDICDKDTGTCKSTQFDGPCSDGNACTEKDTCATGKCAGTQKVCDDKNGCTSDTCDSVKGCQNLPKLGGTPCDDAIGCTTNDQCSGGVCTGTNSCVTCDSDTECAKYDDGNVCTGILKCLQTTKGKVCDTDAKSVVVCPAPADPSCGASLCDPANGQCSIKTKAVGTPCNGGNKCLTQTSCDASGLCKGTAVVCNDGNPCTDDSCDAQKGCIYKARADGEKCDDGSACTPTESCKAGVCFSPVNNCGCSADSECTKWDDGNLCNGTFACIAKFCSKKPNSEIKCDPSKDACKDNTCATSTGKCGEVSKKEGTTCVDNDVCTIQEVCIGGVCKTNAKQACDDNSPCTFDVCDPVFGCANAPVGVGGPCNDGIVCTQADKCDKDGKCAGKKLECDDDNPCTIDVCDSKSGKCAALLDNNLKCDDGDPCSTGDKCLDGICKAVGVKCDDSNPCTVDGCDGKGGCKNILQPDKDCDDGDACTVIDRCSQLGKCAGKKKDCDDANPCTIESCNKGICAVSPATDKPCNDGNACTEKDACSNKGDCSSSPVNCEDDNPCTKVAGPCSTVNGCTIVPDDGKSCNDGSLCTINDKCSGTACQGIKLPCDDSNICTNDSCDPKKGCVNEQNTCNDGNDCTFDKCDLSKGCQSSALDGFQPCDDGDKCTDKGQCNKDKCLSKVVNCDDKNPCTVDTCDSKKGCANLPDENTQTLCSDDNICTDDFCDGKGKCAGKPKECDDGNPCTQDSCDKLKGCVTDDLKEGSACDDSDPCSEKTVCQGGFCSGGNYDKCPACENGLDSDCKLYDDNDSCNGKYTCKKKKPSDKAGYCLFDETKIVCDTTVDTPCAKNTCDTLDGVCKVKQLVNGAACSDGIACTVGDFCQNGQCKTGGVADCSVVEDACNSGACVEKVDSAKGYECVPLPKAGTITCDADGSGCTAHDKCSKGACKAGDPVDCSVVAGECELAACVKDGPNGFTCKITVAKDGSACEDDQLCTANDTCKAGKCQPGLGTYDCKNEIDAACAVPTCDKAVNGGQGGCIGKPTNEGKLCNADANGCTTNDLCVQGFCVPGVPVNCSEKNSTCAVGACKSLGDTSFECIAAPVKESKPCEADNNGCTLDDHCEIGKCVPGKLMDCSKLNGNAGCLVGACEKISSSQGNCVAKPAKLNTPCNSDDNGCTKDDACNADGACLPGAAVNCLAQGNSCATGTCSTKGASAFECGGDPKPDGTKCDADGDGCTIDDTCTKGKCVIGKAADCSKEAKSVCIAGGCNNKGSTAFLCEPTPVKEGSPCDADKNGCTVNDGCKFGFCEPGPLESCKDFQGPCVDAACQDKGGTSFTCAVTNKESYPPFLETVLCDPAAKAGEKGSCVANYICTLGTKDAKEGTCVPKVTVACSDGDLCSEEDACSNGKCIGVKPKDCDDEDDCTLDLCSKGECSHQPIAGCSVCINDTFIEFESTNWIPRVNDPFLVYQRATFNNPAGGKEGNLQITWDGSKLQADPLENDPVPVLRYMHKRMYVAPDLVPVLRFGVLSTMADTECMALYIDDNTQIWQHCGKMAGDFGNDARKIKISLAKHVGRWIDLEFRVTVKKTKLTKGEVKLDFIALRGACGPSCIGEGMEVPSGVDGAPTLGLDARLPPAWRRTATASGYLNWVGTDKAARSGIASMVATYAGPSASGKAETTIITLPAVTPGTGARLAFGLQILEVGQAGCSDGDRLLVRVGGDVVLERCDVITAWKLETIDLAKYANKTVDIEFVVESGTAQTAKGSFLIDDISVTGACTWLCHSESFDSMSQLTWGNFDNKNQPSKWKVALAKDQKTSGTSSLLVQNPTTLKVGDQAFISPGLESEPWLRLPLNGATLVMQTNAFIDPDVCAAGASAAPFAFGITTPGAKAPAPGAVQTNNNFIWTGCKSTSGWAKVSQPVGDSLLGSFMRPLISGQITQGIKAVKVYIDDMQIICK